MNLGGHTYRFEIRYETDPRRIAERVAEQVGEILKGYEGRADVANIKMLIVVTFENFSPMFKMMERTSFKEPLNVADVRERFVNEAREWLEEQLSLAINAKAKPKEVHLSIEVEGNPYRSWFSTL